MKKHILVTLKVIFSIIAIVLFAIVCYILIEAIFVRFTFDFKSVKEADLLIQKIKNDTNNIIFGVFAGIIAVITLFFNYRRTQLIQKQLYATTNNQVYDKLLNAINLLKIEESIPIQTAGIVALESVAKEKQELTNEVLSILSSYLSLISEKQSDYNENNIIFDKLQDTIISIMYDYNEPVKLKYYNCTFRQKIFHIFHKIPHS